MTKGMRKYFKKKIFWFVITLVAAVILNFILPRLMPGDPVNAIVGKNVSPGATQEQIQEQIAFYKHQFGLDKNIFGQFWDFIKNAVSGTFGVSYNQYPRLVSDIIGAGIGETVLVAEGSAARIGCNMPEAPVDAAIVGIIDEGQEL